VTREETWQRLIEYNVVTGNIPTGFERWNLRGADLIGANLSGADLFRADLREAILGSADLSGANLGEVVLIDADVSGANLSRANLSGADLRDAALLRTNLSGANLSSANLFGTDLKYNEFSGVDLSGAKLGYSNLFGANLSGVNLRNAYLNGANLIHANLSDTNLSGADLFGANLRGAILISADLSGANLFGAIFLDAKLSGSNLRDTKIKNVNFNSADLSSADITGALFWGVSTTGWKIDKIKAEYIYFTRSVKEKEEHKRIFNEGQFEALFKTLPTIELIFEGGLSLPEIWTLNAVIDDIKKQNPELNLNLKNISVDPFQTSVGVTTSKDDNLEKASTIIREAFKNTPMEALLTQISKMLALQGIDESVLKPYAQQPVTINQNVTINLIQGDGSIVNSSPKARIECSNIFNNYQSNEDEIDRLFEMLKECLHQLGDESRRTMQASTDRLLEVLKENKEVEKAQEIWNQIKEGVKTAGSAASIISALTKLLGM
jgi:uncharacterized protein YjbI with pentapeptide repeats